ncbi:MAG: discoidin domain-containing protein, partial [Pseudomonadota bacterium]
FLSVRRNFIVKLFKKTIVILLYVIFLVTAVVGVLSGVEWLSKFALTKSYLGDVYPHDFDLVRKDAVEPVTHYDYDFSPGACLEYNVLKGNSYEYANNAGFRDPLDIEAQKPADEFRIFVTGGSTAFGLGPIGEASEAMNFYSIQFIETIAHYMEKILNASAPIEGKRIRVYNAAVWGHAFQHLMLRYPTKLRQYKPDVVISLDGANELPLVSKLDPNWNYFHEGQYNNILRDMFSYSNSGLSSYLTLWLKNNTYLMTYLWAGKDLFQEINVMPRSHKGVAPEGQEAQKERNEYTIEESSSLLDKNIGAVVRTAEDYSALMQNDGIPHILALQPWFYLSKKQLSDREKTIDKIEGYRQYYGLPSDKVYKVLIDKIVESAHNKGYFLVDFSEYFDDVSEWVFTDWCHLTAGANYLLAKELSNLVKEHFLGRPLGPGDTMANKDSFFWDLVASSRVISAPPAKDTFSGPENFQKGYPREALYESSKIEGDNVPEVLLDLNQTYPMSRLRLVWGDEESVPEKWEIDVSTDNINWSPFYEGSNDDIDSYSRWPGFEHYAAEPVEARFVRYRQTMAREPVIKLRTWSLYR